VAENIPSKATAIALSFNATALASFTRAHFAGSNTKPRFS